MTREEQIKKAAKEYADDGPDKEQGLIAQVGFEMGAKWADHDHDADRWISVEDELPPLNQRVLIYDEDEDVIIVSERWRERNRDGWDWDTQLDPTHWMPLPAPPKKGGEQ